MSEEQETERDEDAVLMAALRATLGERGALEDPRYYGAWARVAGRGLEEIMDGELGPRFGRDLVLAVSAFTDVGKNEPELMLRRLEDVRAALGRIEARRREMEEDLREFAGLLEYCRAMMKCIEENVGG